MRPHFVLTFIFGFSIFSATAAEARTIDCDNTATVRCICAASMIMKCGNVTGSIKDEAPLDYLRLVITSSTGQQRTVTIPKPPGGIRAYYAIDYNDWLKKNIPGGLKAGDKMEVAVNGYGLDESTPLFEDPTARRQIATAGGGRGGVPHKCWYTAKPIVLDYPSACSKKACVAEVECNGSGGRILQGAVVCKTIGGSSCPTADECAADPDVLTDEPKNSASLKVESFKKSSAVK